MYLWILTLPDPSWLYSFYLLTWTEEQEVTAGRVAHSSSLLITLISSPCLMFVLALPALPHPPVASHQPLPMPSPWLLLAKCIPSQAAAAPDHRRIIHRFKPASSSKHPVAKANFSLPKRRESQGPALSSAECMTHNKRLSCLSPRRWSRSNRRGSGREMLPCSE